jgi:hypothetical protein
VLVSSRTKLFILVSSAILWLGFIVRGIYADNEFSDPEIEYLGNFSKLVTDARATRTQSAGNDNSSCIVSNLT